MKKVISILAAAVLMLTATNAFAQISVGAGYLNATDKVGDNSTNLNGAYAGVSYNIPISGGFAVAPGLYYSGLFKSGEILNTSILNTKVDSKLAEHFVNVPLTFNLNFELAPDMTAFVYAGPTFQYGLASKTKIEGTVAGYNGDKEIDNYRDGSNYSKTNVLLGGGVGMNVNAFQLSVGYDYGLMNLYTGEGDVNRHKSYVRLGVAYLF